MQNHFLTPLITEFTERLNAAVTTAQCEILATLQGVQQQIALEKPAKPVAKRIAERRGRGK